MPCDAEIASLMGRDFQASNICIENRHIPELVDFFINPFMVCRFGKGGKLKDHLFQ
jgi:hypothetical protein